MLSRGAANFLIATKLRIVAHTCIGGLLGASRVFLMYFVVTPCLGHRGGLIVAVVFDALLMGGIVALLLVAFYHRKLRIMEISNSMRNDLQKILYAQFLVQHTENGQIVRDAVVGILAKLDMMGGGRTRQRDAAADNLHHAARA